MQDINIEIKRHEVELKSNKSIDKNVVKNMLTKLKNGSLSLEDFTFQIIDIFNINLSLYCQAYNLNYNYLYNLLYNKSLKYNKIQEKLYFINFYLKILNIKIEYSQIFNIKYNFKEK